MWVEKLEVKLFVSISALFFEARCWGLSSGFLLYSHGNRRIIKGTFQWDQLFSLGLNKEGEGRLPKAIAQRSYYWSSAQLRCHMSWDIWKL